MEIRAQDLDAAGQKPDYTILPDTPDSTWFLEAKAWHVTLEDKHAIQAINYANTQGKRWVVLSNGREWRLYDNHIIGMPDAKHAATAHLVEDGFDSFLESISKASILGGHLEAFVRNQRLYTSLGSQITKSDSDLVKAIVRVLRQSPGLGSVAATDVVSFFANLHRDNVQVAVVATIEAGPQLEPDPPGPAPVKLSIVETSGMPVGGWPLSGPLPSMTFKRPKALHLPDGSVIDLPYWWRLSLEVATYLARVDKLPPAPLYKGGSSKSVLVAVKGTAEGDKVRSPNPLPPPNSDILVEGNFSAEDHTRSAQRMIESVGLDAAGFRLELAEQ